MLFEIDFGFDIGLKCNPRKEWVMSVYKIQGFEWELEEGCGQVVVVIVVLTVIVVGTVAVVVVEEQILEVLTSVYVSVVAILVVSVSVSVWGESDLDPDVLLSNLRERAVLVPDPHFYLGTFWNQFQFQVRILDQFQTLDQNLDPFQIHLVGPL